MSQRGRRAIKGTLIGLVLIALVVGYYFYLSNRKPKEAAEDTETTVSAVQRLLCEVAHCGPASLLGVFPR